MHQINPTTLDMMKFEAHKARLFAVKPTHTIQTIDARIKDMSVVQSGSINPNVGFWSNEIKELIQTKIDILIGDFQTIENKELLFLCQRQLKHNRINPPIDIIDKCQIEWINDILSSVISEISHTGESIRLYELKEKEIYYKSMLFKSSVYMSGDYKKALDSKEESILLHDKQLAVIRELIECLLIKLKFVNLEIEKEKNEYQLADLKIRKIELVADIEAKKRYINIFEERKVQ